MIKDIIRNLTRDMIEFTKHALARVSKTGLSEEAVMSKLFDLDSLETEEKQNGTHKLVYSLSGKYRLVVAVARNGKLRIVTAYKTSKKIDRLIKYSRNVIIYVKKS